MPKYTKTPSAKKPEGATLKSNKNKQLDKKRGREGAPPQTDYSKYKIDYRNIDLMLKEVAFDQRVPNTHIYYLLGWGRTKFYDICKVHPDFSDYLATKREHARVDKLIEYSEKLDRLALKGNNIAAVIFGLKALGVSDDPHPRSKEAPEEDPNILKPEDFTLAELKQIKKFKDAARKRKAKKVKK